MFKFIVNYFKQRKLKKRKREYSRKYYLENREDILRKQKKKREDIATCKKLSELTQNIVDSQRDF